MFCLKRNSWNWPLQNPQLLFLTRTRWPAAATNLWVLCGGPPQPASPRPWQPGCTWHHWHSCCPWQPHHPGPWHHSQWLKWRRGFICLSGGAIPKIVVKPSHVFTWPPMQDHNFKHNHLLVWRPFVLAIKCFSLIQHVVHVTFYQGNWEMAVLCKFKMEIMYKVWWGTFTLFFGQQIPEQIQGLWFFLMAPPVGCTLHCLALPGGKPTKDDNYLRAKAKPQPQPKAWQGASSSTDDTGWHIAQRRKKKEKKKDKNKWAWAAEKMGLAKGPPKKGLAKGPQGLTEGQVLQMGF